jgi:uncharacterized protein
MITTSFVVAVANVEDKRHEDCVSVYDQQGDIYLLQTTFAEVAYLLWRAGGNKLVVEFLLELPDSKYLVLPLEESDIERTAGILQRYLDARLDFVDATVIAVAEHLNASRILTLDQRDFSIVRPRHRDHFELLPQA